MKNKTFIILFSLALSFTLEANGSLSSLLEPLLEKPMASKQKDLRDGDIKVKKNVRLSNDIKMPQAGLLLSSDIVLSKFKNELIRKFNIKGDLKLSVGGGFPKIVVSPNDWSLQITRFPGSGVEKNILMGLKVVSEGQDVGEWTLPVRCELWRDAYVTARQINSGEKLTSDLVDVQAVNTLSMAQSPVLIEDTDLHNYEARKMIPSDEPLYYRDIREQPDVRKGQVVEVVAQEGLLNISMKALVLEDGFSKDFVSVRNLDSKKKFQAQVINENTVKVYF